MPLVDPQHRHFRRTSFHWVAPVAQQAVGEKIPMTAPDAQVPGAAGTWKVRFTMPSAWTLDTLPVPNDARVSLQRIEPARLAVRRFSGLARPDDVQAQSAALLKMGRGGPDPSEVAADTVLTLLAERGAAPVG